MYKISNISYNYYYSNSIPKYIFEDFLKSSECDDRGKLILTLKPGHEFIHKGPYVIPSIHWTDSFEEDASFEVTCDVI